MLLDEGYEYDFWTVELPTTSRLKAFVAKNSLCQRGPGHAQKGPNPGEILFSLFHGPETTLHHGLLQLLAVLSDHIAQGIFSNLYSLL